MCIAFIGQPNVYLWHLLGEPNVYGMYWVSLMYIACIRSA